MSSLKALSKVIDITDKGVFTLIKKSDFYMILALVGAISFISGLVIGKII